MPCREPAASLHCLPAATSLLELGKEFPTEGAFELAAWTQAGQEGFRWTNHGSTANSLALRCCEAHVARSDKDDRKGCMYVATARRKGPGKPWVVVRLNTKHTCDPDVRKGKFESYKEHAEQKCAQLREQPRKVQPRREKKPKFGTDDEEASDGEQETQTRRTKPRQAKGKPAEEWSAHSETQAGKQSNGEESEDGGDEALDKEVPYPRPRELREFIDECIENGQTSIPLPDEKFDSAVDILAQLFAYAETHNLDLALDSAPYRQGYARYRCKACHSEPGSFQLEIQRNERGVWTLAEKILHHKHEPRLPKTGKPIKPAMDAHEQHPEEAKETEGIGEDVEMAETAQPIAIDANQQDETGQEAPIKTEVEKAEEQAQPEQVKLETSEVLDLTSPETRPKDELQEASQAKETPVSPARPSKHRNSSPPYPATQHQSDLDGSSSAKKPRLTIDTQVNAPKQQPPPPRKDFLSFDHLDSEFGSLPFSDFLLGVTTSLLPDLSRPRLVLLVHQLLIEQGRVSSLSMLARLAAFDNRSLDSFVELFKRNPTDGVDHSPLVKRFIEALKESLAAS